VPALLIALFLLATASTHSADPPAARRRIVLEEYRFTGLPDSARAIPAGVEAWTVTNRGAQLHQLHLVRVPDSMSLAAVHAWLDAGTPVGREPGALTVPVPILLVGASETRDVVLEPGLHVAYCLVPTGHRTTNGEIEQHFMQGMRATFVVTR
jgi:hypothetical protein